MPHFCSLTWQKLNNNDDIIIIKKDWWWCNSIYFEDELLYIKTNINNLNNLFLNKVNKSLEEIIFDPLGYNIFKCNNWTCSVYWTLLCDEKIHDFTFWWLEELVQTLELNTLSITIPVYFEKYNQKNNSNFQCSLHKKDIKNIEHITYCKIDLCYQAIKDIFWEFFISDYYDFELKASSIALQNFSFKKNNIKKFIKDNKLNWYLIHHYYTYKWIIILYKNLGLNTNKYIYHSFKDNIAFNFKSIKLKHNLKHSKIYFWLYNLDILINKYNLSKSNFLNKNFYDITFLEI